LSRTGVPKGPHATVDGAEIKFVANADKDGVDAELFFSKDKKKKDKASKKANKNALAKARAALQDPDFRWQRAKLSCGGAATSERHLYMRMHFQ